LNLKLYGLDLIIYNKNKVLRGIANPICRRVLELPNAIIMLKTIALIYVNIRQANGKNPNLYITLKGNIFSLFIFGYRMFLRSIFFISKRKILVESFL